PFAYGTDVTRVFGKYVIAIVDQVTRAVANRIDQPLGRDLLEGPVRPAPRGGTLAFAGLQVHERRGDRVVERPHVAAVFEEVAHELVPPPRGVDRERIAEVLLDGLVDGELPERGLARDDAPGELQLLPFR